MSDLRVTVEDFTYPLVQEVDVLPDLSIEEESPDELNIFILGEQGLSGVGMPLGGRPGQLVVKTGAHDFEYGFRDFPKLLDMEEDTSHRTVSDSEKSEWSGKSELALGETQDTAYRGDRGASSFAHTLAQGNPHNTSKADLGLGNVDNTADMSKPVSTAQAAALAQKADKTELPTQVSQLQEDSTHRTITDSERANWNGKADLVGGKLPAEYLPGFVDDVLEFPNLSSFPATGESGKLYVDAASGLIYRWTGSIFASTSTSLALGETAQTAYRGDRGAAAYNHSLSSGNPHGLSKSDIGLGNVDNTRDSEKPISTAQATALAGKVDSVSGKGLSSNDFSDAEKTKLEGIAVGADVSVQPDWNANSGKAQILNKPTIPAPVSQLSQLFDDSTHRLVTDTEISSWNGKVDKEAGKGLSSNDYTTTEKSKLSGIATGADVSVNPDWNSSSGKSQILNKPSIPSTLAALSDDSTHRTVTDTEKSTWNNKADLVGGVIPANQLPGFVDDVLEYANLAAFPSTGEAGKIYIAIDTNTTYRWSGTVYSSMSSSLALGETAATAYRGDRGKTAYDHSQATGNPHGTTPISIGLGNVDNTSDANKPVSIATQAALDSLRTRSFALSLALGGI